MNFAKNTASVALAAACALLNGGTLTIYSGTMPTNPETALSGNTALLVYTFSSTALGAPSYTSPNEMAAASFVASSVNPSATGTASFARCVKSDGTTVVMDLTVGTTATDIILGSTAIVLGTPVALSSFALGVPAV